MKYSSYTHNRLICRETKSLLSILQWPKKKKKDNRNLKLDVTSSEGWDFSFFHCWVQLGIHKEMFCFLDFFIQHLAWNIKGRYQKSQINRRQQVNWSYSFLKDIHNRRISLCISLNSLEMMRNLTHIVQSRGCAKGIQPCSLSNQGVTKHFLVSLLGKADWQAPGRCWEVGSEEIRVLDFTREVIFWHFIEPRKQRCPLRFPPTEFSMSPRQMEHMQQNQPSAEDAIWDMKNKTFSKSSLAPLKTLPAEC